MRTETVFIVTSGNTEISFSHPDKKRVDMVYAMSQAAAPYGKRVAIIKMVRYMLDIGLKEAKYFVDDSWT